MYLLPRRSTRLVTEEHKIIFLSRSWMIIITNITIFCPDEIQSPNSKFHSTTNLLEGERKKSQECRNAYYGDAAVPTAYLGCWRELPEVLGPGSAGSLQ